MPEMAFGPLDPENMPPNLKEALKKAKEIFEEAEKEEKDKSKMRGEARAMELRRFFLGLDDENLAILTRLLGAMANEGRHNYLTAIMYGVAIANVWSRDDKNFDIDILNSTMTALDYADDKMPVRPESMDDSEEG